PPYLAQWPQPTNHRECGGDNPAMWLSPQSHRGLDALAAISDQVKSRRWLPPLRRLESEPNRGQKTEQTLSSPLYRWRSLVSALLSGGAWLDMRRPQHKHHPLSTTQQTWVQTQWENAPLRWDCATL